MNVSLEEDWHDRFAAQKHNDLSFTPEYLVRNGSSIEGISDVEFLAQYCTDVQRVFSRVQHHMHRRAKSGYVPLKSCQRKPGKAQCAKLAFRNLWCANLAWHVLLWPRNIICQLQGAKMLMDRT
eukprot:4815953-Karenia_brevis.AAC.1